MWTTGKQDRSADIGTTQRIARKLVAGVVTCVRTTETIVRYVIVRNGRRDLSMSSMNGWRVHLRGGSLRSVTLWYVMVWVGVVIVSTLTANFV